MVVGTVGCVVDGDGSEFGWPVPGVGNGWLGVFGRAVGVGWLGGSEGLEVVGASVGLGLGVLGLSVVGFGVFGEFGLSEGALVLSGI